MTTGAFLSALLFCSLCAAQSTSGSPPEAAKPVCSPGAICFSGKVSAGAEFRKSLNADLEFLLRPGWTIEVVPKRPEGDCSEFTAVVNPPFRAHTPLDIDTSYDWTAEDEVHASPREFTFVTNCADYRVESGRLDIVLYPYRSTAERYQDAVAKLGSSPLGKGRFWITDSRISHAGDTRDNKKGRIESLSFTVEITLP